MDHSKRKFLKGAAIAGGTGLFVAGYSDTLKQVATGLATGSSGKPTRDPIHGNSLAVEYRVDERGSCTPTRTSGLPTPCASAAGPCAECGLASTTSATR